MSDNLFSRSEVMVGLQGTQAKKHLFWIESRTAYMVAQSQQAIRRLLGHKRVSEMDIGAIEDLAGVASLAKANITAKDLERYAPFWATIIPTDLTTRARLIYMLTRKYKFVYDEIPGIHSALSLDDQALQQEFQRLYRKSLKELLEPAQILPKHSLKSAEPEILDSADLKAIEAELEWVQLDRGQCLFKQGEIGDTLYILINGRLRSITHQENETGELISHIGQDDIIGATALIADETYPASVYAVRDSELIKFSRESLERLAISYPILMMDLMRRLAKRLQATSSRQPARSNLKTIVLIPAGPDVPLDEFSHRLVSALKNVGNPLHMTAQHLDEILGQDASQIAAQDPNNIRVVSWLNEQETKYDLLVYQAESTLSPWSQRCIRQADRVFIIAHANASPKPGEVEANLLSSHDTRIMPRQELILLHKDSSRLPCGTARWLTPRSLYRHHHLCWNRSTDFERLARFITGQAVGLVFGGGGTRGFAHIGLIRALEEKGVVIDAVGGTSFGALVGAAYAMGWDYQDMYSRTKVLTKPKHIFDFTLPYTSFLEGKKFSKLLRTLFGETCIEDAWRSYFCISTNLTQTKEMIHQQGPIWKYVRASTGLPMVFAPVNDNGDLLIDGLLVDNLPLAIMHSFNEGGPIIAVDVSAEANLGENYQFKTSLSGWQVLWSRLNPFKLAMQTPPLLDTLERIMEFNSVRRKAAEHNLASLYIRPPVQQFAALDLNTYEQIIDIGYQAGRQALQAWPDK